MENTTGSVADAFEQYIDELLTSGYYDTRGEVLFEAVRLLKKLHEEMPEQQTLPMPEKVLSVSSSQTTLARMRQRIKSKARSL